MPVGSVVPIKGSRQGSPVEWTITTAVREPSLPPEVEVQPLGLTVRNVTKLVSLERKRATTDGALVVGVRNGGGAAESKPALRGGDILTHLNGVSITHTDDFQKMVAAIAEKSTSPTPSLVTFVRDAEEIVAVVRIGTPSENNRVAKPIRPWLGVQTQVLTREIAEALKVDARKGVRVTHVVPDSPAAKAGVHVGDLFLQLDGRVIPAGSPSDQDVFDNLILPYPIGATIAFGGLRNGTPLQLEAQLIATPEATGDLEIFRDDNFELTVRELPLAERIAERLPVNTPGVRVSEVQPNGWAALAGIAPGDILLSIDNTVVKTVAEVETLLIRCRETKPKQVVFFIRRNIGTAFAEVEPRW